MISIWFRVVLECVLYDVPEPVTPIDEVLNTERSKTVFEYVVEYIVGQDGQ